MDRTKSISSGEARRWNDEVEHRRRAYHEKRCAEDSLYKRAYERQLETNRRIQKMLGQSAAHLANAMSDEANLRSQEIHSIMEEAVITRKIKSHEEVLQDRAMADYVAKYGSDGIPGGVFGFAVAAMMLADYDMLKQLQQELDEEQPYAEEIRRVDAEFDKEMIRLSGFEW